MIGRSGSLGGGQFIDGPFWPLNTTLWVKDFKGNDPRFCYYLLRTIDFLQFNVGSGVPTLNRNHVHPLPVSVPVVAEQRRIAGVLAALDDRIEVLAQTNVILESIAQGLFKSWFVDFDPVRAKAEGREPDGMDAATAALFPSEFADSELGPIPKDWSVASLADHVDAERGLSYKGAGLGAPGEGVPMHNLNSVLEGGGYKYAGIKYYTGDYKERHVALAGDLIVANTEQGHHHRLIGFPAIVPARHSSGIYSHHLYRVRPKQDAEIDRDWIYWCLKVPAFREQVIGCANGSTVNMLKLEGLQIPRFVLPRRELCETFSSIASSLRLQCEANVDRMSTLGDLRDTLLPRLISGKLRVPEGQTLLDEAAT